MCEFVTFKSCVNTDTYTFLVLKFFKIVNTGTYTFLVLMFFKIVNTGTYTFLVLKVLQNRKYGLLNVFGTKSFTKS
jgi:hypothetical protein